MSPTAQLVGRSSDCDEITQLVEEHRLVTLLGPGGVGKTRLATEMLALAAERFPGGTYFAELSGKSDEDDIASVVARQLDMESLDALTLRAAGSDTLLVLDNCESALGQAREVATALIVTPGIHVLATSRSPLYAEGERIYPIQPLTVPADDDLDEIRQAAAVELFLDRAATAGAPWQHTDDNVTSVGRLVRQLNGLPLAIELAAARTRVLAPGELADLMEQQLDLLARPGRSEDRHHSLRTAIGASYLPLPEDRKAFLRTLSVMSAPFDLKLAHTVTGAVGSEIETLDALTELVDASLIDVRTSSEGVTRYRFLDSIRAYGLEQLANAGEADEAMERYVNAVADFADAIVLAALESFTPEVLGQIRDQFAHLANAISWCIDHDASPGRTYRMFVPFYGPTGARAEVADLARRIRATWSEPAPLQAEAWAVMGTATFLNGDYEDGAALSAEAIDHPDATSLAKLMAHRTQGFMASLRGETQSAKDHLDIAIEFAESFSASFARELQISRAVVVVDPAESKDSLNILETVGREAARADERVMVVWAAVTSAYHWVLLDDIAAAVRSAEAAVAVADNTGLSWSVSTAHRMMGSVNVIAKGWVDAAPHFRRALDATVTVGDVEGAAMVLRAAAGGARRVGDHELAAGLWATVPPVRGLPVIPSVFHREADELQAELGTPTPLDNGTLVRLARRLLDQGSSSHEVAEAASSPAVEPSAASAGSEPAADEIVRFDDCELDRSMHELRRNGERVHIEPQVYDVLAYLIERRGTVVTKHELMDEVWGDRFVSDSALSSRIKSVRAATGDDGKAQRVIRTVHGKGFTFVAEID